MTPDYSGTAVTIRVADFGRHADIGIWRNACPVDCGWHGSDHEGKHAAVQALAMEARAHKCLCAPQEEDAP